MRGLLIRSPHIDDILSGKKTWEMRSTRVPFPETIALIKSGSGTVVGLADIIDCVGPLTESQRLANEDRHCIPPDGWRDPQFAKYQHAWVLDNIRALSQPVPYQHGKGPVTFIHLGEDVVEAIHDQLDGARACRSLDKSSAQQVGFTSSHGERQFSVEAPRGTRLVLELNDQRASGKTLNVEFLVFWTPRHGAPMSSIETMRRELYSAEARGHLDKSLTQHFDITSSYGHKQIIFEVPLGAVIVLKINDRRASGDALDFECLVHWEPAAKTK